ncbi:MAG: hypothetical protein IPG01_08000 [Chitinophagaceae bacterium]|nr:hypothetical protein [Chitinophagaceae bacterium]
MAKKSGTDPAFFQFTIRSQFLPFAIQDIILTNFLWANSFHHECFERALFLPATCRR